MPPSPYLEKFGPDKEIYEFIAKTGLENLQTFGSFYKDVRTTQFRDMDGFCKKMGDIRKKTQ